MGTREEKPEGRRGALGKGLGSLLGESEQKKSTDTVTNRVLGLPIEAVEPNPEQPRKLFVEEDLNALAASIRADGVLQPIIVSKGERPGKYVLVAGERRWRASRLAGLGSIPAIVKDGASQDLLRLALIENVQRADLNIIEEAEAYRSLIRDYGYTQEQCAQKVGKERATVSNALRLLSLPREVQDDLIEDRLSMGHGRALLSLEDKRQILRARDIIIKKGLNVRQTEQLCKSLKKPTNDDKPEPGHDANLEHVAETLRNQLKTKVKLVGNGQRGKIEISFFSSAELERLLGVMSPGL